mmetsp:Transcript_13470/g.36296  ORF Transcript_13470/g.36296 Transcript_13470/m.36296 type:complete len:238 (+) Transcript_13470:675-1388(+)
MRRNQSAAQHGARVCKSHRLRGITRGGGDDVECHSAEGGLRRGRRKVGDGGEHGVDVDAAILEHVIPIPVPSDIGCAVQAKRPPFNASRCRWLGAVALQDGKREGLKLATRGLAPVRPERGARAVAAFAGPHSEATLATFSQGSHALGRHESVEDAHWRLEGHRARQWAIHVAHTAVVVHLHGKLRAAALFFFLVLRVLLLALLVRTLLFGISIPSALLVQIFLSPSFAQRLIGHSD